MKCCLILALVTLTCTFSNVGALAPVPGVPITDCTAAIPTISGFCRTFKTGFYFNADTDTCIKIRGTGCAATTTNFFPTKKSCLEECASGL